MRPSLGLVVLYRFRDGTDSPAIVTGILDDVVALTVFPRGHLPIPLAGVVLDDGPDPLPDTWRWRDSDIVGPRPIGLAGA